VARGELEATRECIARYGSLVWSMARKFSPTRADAEDAVQEIFLDIWKSADRWDADRGSEAVFVAMLARRKLIDRARARKRRPIAESISEAWTEIANGTDLPDAETVVEASRAAEAIAQLRPEEREVLILSIRHGLTHEEIATMRKLPLGTVKTHARRALLRVRDWLSMAPAAPGKRAS
jgi:RNA polymerase sigma-70 factor (ECF subfamily)